ncbi:MAG: hypothetical protein HZA17_07870 [Nitrospirae bacterium]|nr:hypothetical protein [Nitrospirota bacterium]
MELDLLKDRIKPDIEAIFGVSMASLILNKAKMKVAAEIKGSDELNRCRSFVHHLGKDDKLLGMWGNLEVQERVSKWMKYLGS